jgi:uncharacterized protein YdeI (YjbR/CyaY-like superfamily)
MTPTMRSPQVDVANLLALAIPVELGALLDRSSAARAGFWRLDNAERVELLRFIDEATTASSRARRAGMVGTRLSAAASAEPPRARSWQL